MNKEVKLWDRPALAKPFWIYNGLNLQSLIMKHPDIVIWHVKNHNWQLTEIAKSLMKKNQKV